jgi:hypothetical protein
MLAGCWPQAHTSGCSQLGAQIEQAIMRLTSTASPADAAYARFRGLQGSKALFRIDDPTQSEADARVKLIDPLFRDVLGWAESEIRREASVTKGYVDYVLGSSYNHVLIEAKRSTPRFQLGVPTKARRLKLDGPHLLQNKKMRPVIEQAQAYGADLGVQFCIVTNGPQLLVFRSYTPGRSWKEGTAILFHDYRDIDNNFAEFFALLSRDSVIAGSLIEAFEHLERNSVPMQTVLDHTDDADRELVRNRVWDKIARIMGPLLTDQSEDLATQLEVIANCYVSTPLAAQADSSLDSLIRDDMQPYLKQKGFIDLKPGHRGRTAFSHRLEADIQQARRGTYILTGGVGSGKTTFLRRFAQIVDRELVDEYTVWLHIDFLAIGNVASSTHQSELSAYVYQRVRSQLSIRYAKRLSSDGAQLRALFSEELAAAELTKLYGLDKDSAEWNGSVNAIVDECFRSDAKFVTAAFRNLASSGLRICLILDNTDQLGESFQEAMFLFAQKLSADHNALCVVTLREEKYFAAFRRGIFDAFGDRHFHIGSPDLRQVLRKRLEYGRAKFALLAKSDTRSSIDDEDLQRIDRLLGVLIASTTARNANIVRMLASVSNGDMRLALDMFRDFLSSGNTNVDKIIEIQERVGGYVVPFHEFAKSAILGSRKYYREKVSHIVNVFKKADAIGASHMTASRILSRLATAEGTASAHGQGFVSVQTLLLEFRESFGFADDMIQWAGDLVRHNLVESEPPRVGDVRQADALRITSAGAYYWRYLVRSFAYIDLVYVDTPLADHAVVRRLAQMTDKADIVVRLERVRAFVEYLTRMERQELVAANTRAVVFTEPLMGDIKKQIETEIKVISKKTKVKDVFGPD